MNTYLFYSFCLLIGYLIGSILFARLITKLVTGRNITELGNRNPGAYNVFRNVGKKWGDSRRNSGCRESTFSHVNCQICFSFFKMILHWDV